MKKINLLAAGICFGCSLPVNTPPAPTTQVPPSPAFAPPPARPHEDAVLSPADFLLIDALFHAAFDTACEALPNRFAQEVTEVTCAENSTSRRALCTCEVTADPSACGLPGERARTYRLAEFVKVNDTWQMRLRPPD